jgi:hypothetical protein
MMVSESRLPRDRTPVQVNAGGDARLAKTLTGPCGEPPGRKAGRSLFTCLFSCIESGRSRNRAEKRPEIGTRLEITRDATSVYLALYASLSLHLSPPSASKQERKTCLRRGGNQALQAVLD